MRVPERVDPPPAVIMKRVGAKRIGERGPPGSSEERSGHQNSTAGTVERDAFDMIFLVHKPGKKYIRREFENLSLTFMGGIAIFHSYEDFGDE